MPLCHPYQGSLTKGGRLSTVDLLVLTSFEQLIFMPKYSLPAFTKQATLTRRSTVLRAFPFSKASLPKHQKNVTKEEEINKRGVNKTLRQYL